MPQLPLQQLGNNENLTSSKLLLVEGKDEAGFCKAFLTTLAIGDVQIIDVGGRFKFSDNIQRLLKRPNFNTVQMLGILRDAEDKPAENTFASVCSDLKRVGLPQPQALTRFSDTKPSVGVFVMPDNRHAGMLEDLCLESLANTDGITHTDDFFTKASITESAKDFSKRRIQAWLSIAHSEEYLQREVGRAAEAGFWNFDHPCFTELKAFLEQFSKLSPARA
ncbi:MAG: hypothetical protein MUF71_20260 [Candidatus Kapabacteria bacterium]|jgi:hypothetical protein|nr:hypothetical protein [Candidatus Kapabacteria bacterium]